MKVGLIGIDSLKDENHFLSIKEALGKNLYGMFSPHTEEILPICQNSKVELYTSANDLFTKVHAVYFAKSLKPNLEFAFSALKKSCHLFIDDISSLNMDEIKQLYKVAFEAHARIQLKLTKSFSPEYTQVREFIGTPKLIEINQSFTSIVRIEDYFTEFLNNLFLADQNINSGIKKVTSVALPFNNNHFSLIHIRIDYDNGAIVNMKLNNISSELSDSIIFHENEKTVNTDFIKHFSHVHTFTNGKIIREVIEIVSKKHFVLEMTNFLDLCKNQVLQNISESPSLLKIIQNTYQIMDQLDQTAFQKTK